MIERLPKTRLIAISIWLLAVASSFAWNKVDDIREKNDIATGTARVFFDQIIDSRRWNLMHGGVYVYTTKDSPPNLYLPKEKQYIKDEGGKRLTLINPSYMTRQLAAISQKKGKISFHITSLTPLRPENKPYPWEIPWLESFALGSSEESSFSMEDGEEIFHYMAPLLYSEACTPCHLETAQPKGNIRGGISVSIPNLFHKSQWPLLISHIFVAMNGIFGILFLGGRLARSRRNILETNRQLEQEIKEHRQTEKELIAIQENLETTINCRTSELRNTNSLLDSKVKEQQRIEAALVAINDEFIQIFNSAPDGMHVIDRNFNIVRANRAYHRLTDKKAEEIQGHKCHDVFPGKLCHTEQCPLIQIRNGSKWVEVETDKTRGDSKIIPCIVTATPFKEPGGKLSGIIIVTKDISNWKKIEQSLAATTEYLQARNVELEDFAHIISHDLQEPLMLIRAFSERIRTRCASDLPEKGISYLERIEISANRMQELIDGLLLYSRVSSKAIPFQKVNLKDTIDSVLEDLAIKIEKNDARITIDPGLPIIEADPLQMRQLFQNIIGNSLKYTHQDRKPEITIQCIEYPDRHNNRTYAHITIEDNGIGFKTEHKLLIFDIFKRLHNKQHSDGMGIGLSICKKIIKRHGGTITAKGMQDQGALFIITLPLQQKSLHKENKQDNDLIDIIMNRR